MNRAQVIQKLGTIQNLPTLPEIIYRLDKALRDPNAGNATAARIIQDDPSMMTRILKVVNSAFYGVGRKVDNIQQAVSLLGMVAIKNLALTTAVFSTFDSKAHSEFNRKEFWKHSIAVGIGVKAVYDLLKPRIQWRLSPETLRLSGLVHDIGKIVYEQFFHASFIEAAQKARLEEKPLNVAEKEVIGIDHTEVGSWLVRKWGLPMELGVVVRWHHDPDSAPEELRELVILCHLADYICNEEDIGSSGNPVPVFDQADFLRNKGLSIDNIFDLAEKIRKEAEQSELLLALTTKGGERL